MIYITDMSRCLPSDALSTEARNDAWQLFPYTTCEAEPGAGTMIGAPSFVTPPEVTLPLNVTGWHEVHIGYWNPHHDYDGGATVKVRLDDDPCFVRLCEPEPKINYRGTFLSEAPFKTADLTGRSLVFGKVGGPFAEKAYVAYVRLVPLDDGAVAALQADRARADTRIAQACIDGISYFHHNEYRTEAHLLELVEPFRHSDVGRVIWAVCYGDLTNYPTEAGTYWAAREDIPADVTPARSPHVVGTRTSHEDLRDFAAQGVIPQAVVGRHVHEMGLKFDLMFRLAMFGHVPPRSWGPVGDAFVATHPEFRQVLSDGAPAEKASYAFPETREKMLSIIRESAERFDLDGAVLAFNRGPQFTAYEQPVLDDFRAEFGEDATTVALNDPRMAEVRSRYLTQFVRDARRVLDEVGEAKGRRIELGAYVYGQAESNRAYGFDVAAWVREGLLDSVIGSVGRNAGPLDPELIAVAREHGCRATPGIVSWMYEDLVSDALDYLYPDGAEGILLWDADTLRLDQRVAMSRLGHREEYAALAREGGAIRTIPLKTVAGCDVAEGLAPAAYSGG